MFDLMSPAVKSANLKREQKGSENPVLRAGNASDLEREEHYALPAAWHEGEKWRVFIEGRI